MNIFIDTASIGEIKAAQKLGILDGITTNPSLIARTKMSTGKKFRPIIEEIAEACPEIPISVEVLSLDHENMIREGKDLCTFSKTDNIVVKLPCTEQGLKACYELSQEGIKTNMTVCFSPLQAWLVAKAGATYVSPFVGRLDDIGEDGMQLVGNIKMIYANYQYQTKILVASVRNPIHILNSARIGADIVTVPFNVIGMLMKHPKTDEGIQKFLEDAKNANQGIDK